MKRTAFQKFCLLNIAVLFAIVAGCHSNAPKSKAPPSTLHTISISSKVLITGTPTYEAKGKGAPNHADELKTMVENSAIDLRHLVLNDFHQQLVRGNVPVTVVEADSEAELQIEIGEYGLIPRDKTSILPLISLDAKLVKANGHIIWEGSKSVDASEISKTIGQPWQNYAANPSLLKSDFDQVIEAATTAIVDELVESHQSGEITD